MNIIRPSSKDVLFTVFTPLDSWTFSGKHEEEKNRSFKNHNFNGLKHEIKQYFFTSPPSEKFPMLKFEGSPKTSFVKSV